MLARFIQKAATDECKGPQLESLYDRACKISRSLYEFQEVAGPWMNEIQTVLKVRKF